MIERDYSKSLVLDFSSYINEVRASFVIDDEDDINTLVKCFERFKEMDNELKVFVITYPENENGEVYADNVLIQTSLDKISLEEEFSKHIEIEPYYIESINEEEKDSAEWIDITLEEISASAKNVFSIYWD